MKDIQSILKNYIDPCFGPDFPFEQFLQSVEEQDGAIIIRLQFGLPTSGINAEIEQRLRSYLQQQLAIEKVQISITNKIQAHQVQGNVPALPGVKNVIAVASGKGGVGKSTTAINLALALQSLGARVGILDADIYGPNQPHMLGATAKPELKDEKTFIPVTAHGLQSMSIGYLVDTETPMVWRGPMVSQALQQITLQTQWDDLDYLIVDMPPGTGDIQLTLSKKVPVSGAVIVTTPQDIALLDARKGIEMFRKVNVAILGVIENMSTHVCPECGHVSHLFGEHGGSKLAAQCEVPVLGEIPLALSIRQAVDGGKPTMVADPESEYAQAYRQAALRLAAYLARQPRNYAVKFPKVVVE